MRRYIAAALLLLLAPILVASALSYSPIPPKVTVKGTGTSSALGIPDEFNASGYFQVSPGPAIYLRLEVLDTFESCKWISSRPTWGRPSVPANAKLIGNFTIRYPVESDVILATTYASNFTVPVKVDLSKGIYRAYEPVSTYSFLAWNVSSDMYPLGNSLTVFSQTFDVFPYAHLVPSGMSPYEKALFIEKILRENFVLGRSAPKTCNGLVDFLYITREGDPYDFASAFVSIARTLGLPSRIVKGYYVPPSSDYRWVSIENVTYWPEVYLPERGWTIFNPLPTRRSVITVESGEKFSEAGYRVYYNGGLRDEVSVTVGSGDVLYLPLWNGSLSYLRIVGSDPKLDILNLPTSVSPGQALEVLILERSSHDVKVYTEVPHSYSPDSHVLKLRAPTMPGVYWVTVEDSIGGSSVKFPIVVFGNATVTVDGYPQRIHAGDNLTIIGRVYLNGEPLNGGIVQAVLGRNKGDSDYVIGTGVVDSGRYIIHGTVPSYLPAGRYWLVVKYLNFPYYGDSDPLIEVLPPRNVELTTPELVRSGVVNITGSAPVGSVLKLALDNGPEIEVNVNPDGTFSVPMNVSPGEHTLTVQLPDGSKIVKKISAVNIKDVNIVPFERMGKDYLKLSGVVEGMDDGKVLVKTPYGSYEVPVHEGEFSTEIPVSFPSRGAESFPIEIIPKTNVNLDRSSLKFVKDVFLARDKLVPSGENIVKTSDGKFLVVNFNGESSTSMGSGSETSTPGNGNEDTVSEETMQKFKAVVEAYTKDGRRMNEIKVKLGSKEVEVEGGKGEVNFEVPKPPSLPGTPKSDFGSSIDLPSPPSVSGSGFSIPAEFMLVFIGIVGLVVVTRFLGSADFRSSFVSTLKSLGSPKITLNRRVYIPGERIIVKLSHEADLYVDGRAVGRGTTFSLKLPRGVHILRAGHREVEIYVLEPKNAVVKLYEEAFLPFAESNGVRTKDATPKEIMRGLLEVGLPKEELRTITSLFEFARYGDVDLSVEDFRRFLAALKKLGVIE